MIKLLIASFLLMLGFQTENVIRLNPTQNIIPIINLAPANTRFEFMKGIYKVGKLQVKAGQQFIGLDSEVVLNGARIIPNSQWKRENGYWTASVNTNRNFVREAELCLNPTINRCNIPEDLYINDQFLQHVGSKALLKTGTWFLERTETTEKVFVIDNPIDQKVEISVEPRLFTTSQNQIVVRNIIIEKYATPLQMAALELKGQNNLVQDVIFRLNHAAGLEIWGNSLVFNSGFVQNGQKGLGGAGENLVIRENFISQNNMLNVDPNWDGGASKFANTSNLIVEGNQVTNNNGHGLWCDVRNVNCTFRNNDVRNQNRNGIFCEWGVSCIVENNFLSNNGWRSLDRLGDASITILDNNHSVIRGNVIEVFDRGNAISIYEDERSEDFPILTALVEDNIINFINGRGTVGYGTNPATFIDNSYFTTMLNYQHFYAGNQKITFNQFKTVQNDDGVIQTFDATPTPTFTLIPTVTKTLEPTITITPTITPTKIQRRFRIALEGIITIEEIE